MCNLCNASLKANKLLITKSKNIGTKLKKIFGEKH